MRGGKKQPKVFIHFSIFKIFLISSLFVPSLQDITGNVGHTPSKMFSEKITKYRSVKWMDHKEQHFFKGKQVSWYSSIWSFIGCHLLPQNILGNWIILFLYCFLSKGLYAVLLIPPSILIECFHSFLSWFNQFLCKFHFKDSHIWETAWVLPDIFSVSVLWTIIALGFLFINHTCIPAYIFKM